MRKFIAQDLATLNTLRDHVHAVATEKGFHDPDLEAKGMSRYIANLHGEVTELWDAYREDKLNAPCDKAEKMLAVGLPALTCAEEEIADIIIRALDTARAHNVDVAYAVATKDAFNQTRENRHGGKIA
jgi:NTP pyrophosphatase (non-canonical NTP hydrolase)